jgi:hypothetical protein
MEPVRSCALDRVGDQLKLEYSEGLVTASIGHAAMIVNKNVRKSFKKQ